MEGVGSPFQAFEPVDAVPFSPFALAKHAADFPGGEVPLATPMEPSLVPEFSRAGIESPFKPAETSSPFQAVSDAVPAPTEESTIPEIAPQAVMVAPAEPEVPAERDVLRGELSPACGLGLPQLHAVDLIHIVPDDRRVAEVLRDLLLTEGFQAEVTDSVPTDSCAAIVMSGLSQITSSDQASAIQLEAFKAAR